MYLIDKQHISLVDHIEYRDELGWLGYSISSDDLDTSLEHTRRDRRQCRLAKSTTTRKQ